jgi:hypothetical protein
MEKKKQNISKLSSIWMKILNDIAYNLNWILIWLNSKFEINQIELKFLNSNPLNEIQNSNIMKFKVSFNVFEFNSIQLKFNWDEFWFKFHAMSFNTLIPWPIQQ